MEAFVSGAWENPSRGEILLGGTWRRLTRAEAYISGQWRQIAVFTPPLSVTAPDVNAVRRVYGAATVTGSTTATPVGGLAPYSYSAAVLTGAMSVSNATTATPSFSQYLASGQESTGTARITCTDAAANVATAEIAILLRNLEPIDIGGLE